MWNLDGTERLVARLLPLIFALALVVLVLMSLHYEPARLGPAFATSVPPAAGHP
jgi:hypothetical protein